MASPTLSSGNIFLMSSAISFSIQTFFFPSRNSFDLSVELDGGGGGGGGGGGENQVISKSCENCTLLVGEGGTFSWRLAFVNFRGLLADMVKEKLSGRGREKKKKKKNRQRKRQRQKTKNKRDR